MLHVHCFIPYFCRDFKAEIKKKMKGGSQRAVQVNSLIKGSGVLSICLSVILSICLSVYLSICLSVYLSICLSIYRYICPSVYLSICPSVYLSIVISVSLSLCLSIYKATNKCKSFSARGGLFYIQLLAKNPSQSLSLINIPNWIFLIQ